MKFVCPCCGKEIEETELYKWYAAVNGSKTSIAKKKSSAENGRKAATIAAARGKKVGRPRKPPTEQPA
jgi:hypothetical protein